MNLPTSPQQAKVFEKVCDIIIKMAVAAACIIGFIVFTIFLVFAEDKTKIQMFGIIESILAATFYVLVAYYFLKKSPKEKKPYLLYITCLVSILAFIGACVSIYLHVKK